MFPVLPLFISRFFLLSSLRKKYFMNSCKWKYNELRSYICGVLFKLDFNPQSFIMGDNNNWSLEGKKKTFDF